MDLSDDPIENRPDLEADLSSDFIEPTDPDGEKPTDPLDDPAEDEPLTEDPSDVGTDEEDDLEEPTLKDDKPTDDLPDSDFPDDEPIGVEPFDEEPFADEPVADEPVAEDPDDDSRRVPIADEPLGDPVEIEDPEPPADIEAEDDLVGGGGRDLLIFSGHSRVNSFDDLAVIQGVAGVVITDGASGRILLSGIEADEIDHGDFIF